MRSLMRSVIGLPAKMSGQTNDTQMKLRFVVTVFLQRAVSPRLVIILLFFCTSKQMMSHSRYCVSVHARLHVFKSTSMHCHKFNLSLLRYAIIEILINEKYAL